MEYRWYLCCVCDELEEWSEGFWFPKEFQEAHDYPLAQKPNMKRSPHRLNTFNVSKYYIKR